MTSKDYDAFAIMLRRQKPREDADGDVSDSALHYWLLIVGQTADIFAADNPHFNRPRFYTACGIEGYQ